MHPSDSAQQRGFTLVELAVVVVILGVLASFGVPRFMSAVERSKSVEAFEYLATVQSAQERYVAREGKYANKLSKLDLGLEAPKYFKVAGFKVPADAKNYTTGWSLTLTRQGKAAGYGKYTVTYTQKGFDPSKSTIPDDINPRQTGS
ncbi:MAG: prepilin-type N-terminal cleavage/methylation domain-containing protein [Planctomycetes bacterium]|nr:prepilin-type N-terminal cleavage/methylation domain-containing protein [Planctomycetota bacterium]